MLLVAIHPTCRKIAAPLEEFKCSNPASDKPSEDVPDFPKPGIMFKDITPILMDHQLCMDVAEHMVEQVEGWNVDAVVGVESRGFLFGMMVATGLKVPFIPVRKAGKLPYQTVSHAYEFGIRFGRS